MWCGSRPLLRVYLVAGLLLLPRAWASNGPDTPEALKAALREVLAHGDLSDIRHLSKTLSLGLRVLKPDPRAPEAGERVIATQNPASLWASGLTYQSRFIPNIRRTRREIEFQPRICPTLRDWGAEWNLKVDWLPEPHAVGFFEVLQWPGRDGISIEVFHYTRGGCEITLSQVTDKAAASSAPRVSVPRTRDMLSVRQIVDILVGGDLRDYKHVAGVLRTELIAEPQAARDERLYKGSVELARVVPGMDPGGFSYYGNDSGWVAPPDFNYQPRHLAPRTVVLSLTLDTERVCIAPASIEFELKRRSIAHRVEVPRNNSLTYSVQNDNLISLTFKSASTCVQGMDFNQTTDFARGLQPPIVFVPKDSLDANRNLLPYIVERINTIVEAANNIPPDPSALSNTLKEINVVGCGPDASLESIEQPTILLTELIKQSLVDRGIPSTQVTTQLGGNLGRFPLCQKLQGDSDSEYVLVDVVAN